MRSAVAATAGLLAASLHAGPLTAQARDTSRAAPPPVSAATQKHIKPVDALWRSLLIPGWGQAATGRNMAGAAFAVWEGVTIMMTARAVQEKHYMEETGSANVASKDQQIQDWVVLLIFNHLFAAAEAYVAAHLMDFPKELQIRAGPGGAGIGVTLPAP